MKKLLIIIAALIMCDAYGDTNAVIWAAGTATSASTCDDGGNITKPADPTKEGYKFKGWNAVSVPDEVADFITWLITNINTNASASNPTSNGTAASTWSTTWEGRGTVAGEWRCSSDKGSAGCISSGGSCSKSNDPAITGTTNSCWCKTNTFYKSSNNRFTISSLPWVEVTVGDNWTSASDCASSCARICAYFFLNYQGYRRAVFGVR